MVPQAVPGGVMIWIFSVSAFLVSAFLSRMIAGPWSRISVMDNPNERSLHQEPVPSGGGIAILAAFFLCGTMAIMVMGYAGGEAGWLAVGTLPLAAVSYLDDRKGVPARYRLLVHFTVATVLVFAGFIPSLYYLPGLVWAPSFVISAAICMVFVVWLTNLYNFMDGMDGFAGGMAVCGFGFMAYFGFVAGAQSFFMVSLLLSFASLGFLMFNFPPARLFMGDVGSAPLGYLAGGLTLWGTRDNIFPIWSPLLLFAPFIVDATVTLIRRLLNGEKVWQAHRTHYYQRLVQLGWGHKKTVLAEYVLMISMGISAVLLTKLNDPAIIISGLAAWALIYGLIAAGIGRLESN